MHVHLSEPGKANACKEYIEQLEACHKLGLIQKYSGGCNDYKNALNRCLRDERTDRTTKNREESKLRKGRYEAVKAEYE